MANEKMELIKHMALLRNIANDVTEITSSTTAADFINAAIEIINNYPSDGKLVDTGNSCLNIPIFNASTLKICSGCGHIEGVPLGLNKLDEPYLGCCPDNNHIPIKEYWENSKYLR